MPYLYRMIKQSVIVLLLSISASSLTMNIRSGMYPIIRLFQVLPAVEDDSPAHTVPIGRLFLKEKAVRLKIIIYGNLPAALPFQEMVSQKFTQLFPQCFRLRHCFQVTPALEFNLRSGVFLQRQHPKLDAVLPAFLCKRLKLLLRKPNRLRPSGHFSSPGITQPGKENLQNIPLLHSLS